MSSDDVPEPILRPVGGDPSGEGGDPDVSPAVRPAGLDEVAGGRRESRAAGRGSGRSGRRGSAQRDLAPGHPEDPPGDPDTVARLICLRLLTGQPRTRAELATALARRGVPGEAASRVLSRFAEVGLIDDKAFAAAWVGSRHAGRGLGRRALSAELRGRGVDDRTVVEAIADLDPDTELATARTLVRRRLPSTARVGPGARVRRLVGLLARKGYPPAVALRAVREELSAAGDDEAGTLTTEDAAGGLGGGLDAEEGGHAPGDAET